LSDRVIHGVISIMKGFGAQGVALLLLVASSLTHAAETVSQASGAAPAAAEVIELQKALQESRAEAELIQNRNQKLAERRQSLEKRIADLREQLQQEQSTEPTDSSPSAASAPEDVTDQTVTEGGVAVPQPQE
jgi:septal ring factor EnvC (AmiA/AmiB activator)